MSAEDIECEIMCRECEIVCREGRVEYRQPRSAECWIPSELCISRDFCSPNLK